MLEFWILEGPLNTRRGTPARHRAAFGWFQHRRCRGMLLAGWSKGNLLIRNTVRRPLILPKRQGIQCSHPSRWRSKEWNSFHLHTRLEHNKKEKKKKQTQTPNISHTTFQYRTSQRQQTLALHCYTSYEGTRRVSISSLWDSLKKICSE